MQFINIPQDLTCLKIFFANFVWQKIFLDVFCLIRKQFIMKISPITIRYNTQTPISKKTKNTESGLQFELSKHSQTNPVYFSGLFTSKKTKVDNSFFQR